ncbi:N-acyl homoserine lactonase family protein [Rhodopila globiformis]|uniref:MBL fold metallo-hydrolase n=1 Tax=Rhodopila globiformis TaxID=1071 RepID=A0A2S6NGG8_RHOGL|nr:N-acyl homoserine lactonase family protein [Rhodopila globiformis]PPQ33745.1 MBL fold metallo-hydrolase [Rhodopila globiformis]
MKMHLLSGGRLRYRRGIYYPGADREETIELPVSCALLKHKQGLVLFDTGCHPSVVTNAEARWGGLARLMAPVFAEQQAVINQLPLAGVTAGDVDVVVCSHLHPDHCGCNVFFPRATVLIQATEIAAARAGNSESRGYRAIEWDLPNPIEPLDGARDLFGDGRITLLHVPGHTPGMMAAHVVLDRDGAFVLASDSVAVRAHLDERYAPKNTWNVDQAIVSIETIARLQQDGATVLFGHDAAQWASLRTGAEPYV